MLCIRVRVGRCDDSIMALPWHVDHDMRFWCARRDAVAYLCHLARDEMLVGVGECQIRVEHCVQRAQRQLLYQPHLQRRTATHEELRHQLQRCNNNIISMPIALCEAGRG